MDLPSSFKSFESIAETEKYAHVTFFFNGGEEEPFPGEERILIPSVQVATYDLQPEMSAVELRDKIIHYMQDKQPNFICLNFANPDMLGHTGNFAATVAGLEVIDQCLHDILQKGYLNTLSISNKFYSILLNALRYNNEKKQF